MAHLVVFEPLTEREAWLLKELRDFRSEIKLFKDLDALKQFLDTRPKAIVIVDLDHLSTDFVQLVEELRSNHPSIYLIGLSSKSDEKIWQLILKTQVPVLPVHCILSSDLSAVVKNAVGLMQEQSGAQDAEPIAFIGEDPAIKEILNRVDLISNSDVHVLITGETGSGKTVLAKLIHQKSKRCNEAFIHINCAAIPEQLLEAELFGFKRGSFTGALRDTPGKFKAAGKGTILLDEIAEMPVHLQAKLLKVLDEGQYYPVGATQTETVQARIIAATNKNLKEEMEAKRFRTDLFYRLNSFEIHIPALREHPDDIPLLFDYYVHNYIKKYGLEAPGVDLAVYEVLKQYAWPGNIRELQNLVETLMYMKPKVITLEMLPQKMFSNFSATMIRAGEELRPLEEVKRQYAFYVWELVGRNKSKAARVLNVDIKTMRKLLRRV